MFDPRRLRSLFGGGSAAARPGDVDLARDPELRAALSLLVRGRSEEALAALEAVLAEERLAPALAAEASSKRGVALVALGRRSEALEAFAEALLRDERCAPALVNLGNLLLEDGAPHDAIDFYEAALRADAAYAPAHRGLGVAWKRLGRRGDSVRAFRAESRHAVRRPKP